MNVLLIGSGGREHAIAWKLAQSKSLDKLYIAPGNAGTVKCGENVPIAGTETDKLLDFAKQNDVELVVVGPEDPLAAGVVDEFEAAGIKAFGPSREAAQLEADKAFAKQLMRSAAVSTAEGRIFDRFKDAKAYIASRDEAVVIKAAGLAKGKGVFVCEGREHNFSKDYVIFVPGGREHQFRNIGSSVLKFLCLVPVSAV